MGAILNVISLFTGSGMLDRSVEAAFSHFGIQSRVVCYVENSKAAQEVIRARVRDGLLSDAPIWETAEFRADQDIRRVAAREPREEERRASTASNAMKRDRWLHRSVQETP